MERSNFKRLLKRYLAGQVSELERKKLETWLDVYHPNQLPYDLTSEEEEILFRKIIDKRDNFKEIESFKAERHQVSGGWLFMRIAATLLVLALVSYSGWYLGIRNNYLEVVSAGEVEKEILSDGSLVWLKRQSKLLYFNRTSEGIRYAELQGDALFEVAKDAAHPFVIQCGRVTLKVLGTSFYARAVGDSLELSVLTGRVNVAVNGKEVTNVLAKEKLIYVGHGEPVKANTAAAEVYEVVKDTEYDMQFVNIKLKEIAERLHQKFDVTVDVEDALSGNCRITADLTDQSLENSLQRIADVLDVSWQKVSDGIVITGRGCY